MSSAIFAAAAVQYGLELNDREPNSPAGTKRADLLGRTVITTLGIKAQRLKSQAALEKTQRQLAILSDAAKDALRQQPQLVSLS